MKHLSPVTRAFMVSLLVVACRSPSRSEHTPGAETPAPSVSAPSASAPSAAIALPSPPARRGLTQHGSSVTVDREGAVGAVQPLPPAIHHHGERGYSMWVAPNGDAWAAAYMITGRPGPDTGAVYRTQSDGSWKMVLSRPGQELDAIWGSGPTDIWAVGKIVLRYDGAAWNEERVPRVERANAVWGSSTTDVYLLAHLDGTPYNDVAVVHRSPTGDWKVETVTARLSAIGGAGAHAVWVVGARGTILRSHGDGKWVREDARVDGGSADHSQVWASAADDVWVAGSALYHSNGDGQWQAVDVGSREQIVTVWGRSNTDVYAGALGNKHLLHLAGGTWTDIVVPGVVRGMGSASRPGAPAVVFLETMRDSP